MSKMKDAIRIDNWSVCPFRSYDPYTPPEAIKRCLCGDADHPRIGTGTIITSFIVGFKGRIIETHSGSKYYLGSINKEYRKWLKVVRPNWDWRKPFTDIN